MSQMTTFKDLYIFLQSYEEDNIISWLKEHWTGKDKQESLLRLFAGLGLIHKLKEYDICKGNFNKKTITKKKTLKDVFYNKKDELINLKDKGDSSDLTGISKSNSKHLLVTTSKNINKTQVGKLDIDKILTNFHKYHIDGFTMVLCICIRSNDDFERMKMNIEETNKELKSILINETTIIIDWYDLNEAFHQFKLCFANKSFDSIIHSNQNTLCLKMHQQLGVMKTIKMKNNGEKNILWGHIQRSGKSYIIGGCIIEDCKEKNECNYLIITTAPNETIEQQQNVFDCVQLNDFNVIILNGQNKKASIKNKNIIICSKQFLQTKLDKSISWLKKMSFDMRFIDESHNGGTTELAQKTLDCYGKQSCTIQITATYLKPIQDYNIPKTNWILWDLEDIKLCKNISSEDNLNALIRKHGDDINVVLSKYSKNNIINEYSKYPELWILTHQIKADIVSEIINQTKDNNYGWSTDACFLLKQGVHNNKIILQDEFQNESENLKVWYNIFGKKSKFGIPEKEYSDNLIFMKRIENICKNPTINSRFFEEENIMIIMCFLPQTHIDEISKATIKLLTKHNVIPEYDIISINSKITHFPKQTIEDARIKAINSKKKGVLVLSGKQCSLGVSIENCDIVLLLNNSMSYDMVHQMMFRCMTEGNKKKCGLVIDLNIHRVIEISMIHYASLVKPDEHPVEATKHLLKERLINLNGDHWMPTFGNDFSKLNDLCKSMYEIYSSNTVNALNQFLNRLCFKHVLLTTKEQKVFNVMFKSGSPTKQQKQILDTWMNQDNDENINIGIENIEVETDTSSNVKEEEEEESKFTYMIILKHIIPLICLLTIHDKETSFVEMFKVIKNNEYIYHILIDQTKSWWGDSVDSKLMKMIIKIFIKHLKDDKEVSQIIRTVKELFIKNIQNSRELSSLIDEYLIPQELEKKSNAEVSTPFRLRQEMMDKVPIDFWKSIQKVFEPCSGKGGFLLDIIDRFMIGLHDMIPDEQIRYKTIVEECLYFSDINPTNIFICKLLVDPYNHYALNYYEGNTLELDIQEKWNMDGFQAVIGNPPYNASGDTGTGNTIWQDFTKKSLNQFLTPHGYLVFVHPPGWRKPNTTRGKFYGLYDLMTYHHQMHFLSIHGIKDGQQTFHCGTRYDWYMIEKTPKYTTTLVNDENRNELIVNMNDFKWLPNYNIDTIKNILATHHDEDRCPIIYDRTAYGADKKDRISKTKSDVFKYPCIHSTPKCGTRYMYSKCNDKGHFGVPKIIFGESGIHNPIIDIDGLYGMTHGAMGIEIDSEIHGQHLSNALTSPAFMDVVKSCNFSSFRIDWNIFKDMKKDFWKEFI